MRIPDRAGPKKSPTPGPVGRRHATGESTATPCNQPREFPAPPTRPDSPEGYASTTVILLHCRKWGVTNGQG